ncbi:allophanate hydrolase 2 subunit 1 [Tatumella ptyseos ATCC 33301]|uniref:Allophanate hydrolase 2 subunit 1 n=2 Tax=Tatumella ptyseos TaxID=82987 RepID=A0A085JFA7_9GAMM|nr:allophanate hydrolase 2 subunit 1 [Tatumella ptyseos ATCC 33301]SQK75312.1 Sporulation inhibitor kipI [Tatumella ptyseos]
MSGGLQVNDKTLPGDWVVQPIADQAINIDFGEVINTRVNERVTSLVAAIKKRQLPGITGLVPAYRSVTISYDALIIRQSELIHVLEELIVCGNMLKHAGKCWQIPACYGGEYGIDLLTSASALGLTTDELISLHSAAIYRIYMIGFMPGFAYLGGLDERLHLARRTSPRAEVPGGSISIGGQQSAIGSVAAPSGWHLLARTPVKNFDPNREQPFLFNAGENVRFIPVSERDYLDLMAERDFQPEWVTVA